MQGFLGDQIMINGQPNYTLPVENRSYRLRLLNGSNSRIYKLAWDDGSPITVIGTDGGLIEKPETMPYVMLAPAERRELWVDFSDKPIGTELILRSIPFEGASMHGGMGRMMSRGTLPAGSDYAVLKVKVTSKATSNDSLPTRLTPITPLKIANAANSKNPRTIRLSMGRMSALLNNRSYKMNDIQPDEIIPINTLQLMEFDNGFSGGGGRMGMNMAMPHPMHLHGEQFQIIKRDVNPRFQKAHSTISQGLVDSGWKDTTLVMPGEKVTFLKPFNDFKGLFMYHCHNLEHEDMGMMRDYLVR
jgi:suppressor of ftsI